MNKTVHYARKFSEPRTYCGEKVVGLAHKPDSVVQHHKYTCTQHVTERGDRMCTTCVERQPLVDLGDTVL